MFRDHVKLAIKNLRHRMSRSLLTLLGIAIGIMAIISLMALGEGMQQAITGELSSLSDVIIVSTGGNMFSSFGGGGSTSTGEYFTQRDIAGIERLQGIKEVSTQLSGSGLAEYNGKTTVLSLTGMEVSVMKLQYASQNLEAGGFLNEGEQNKIMIGYSIAHDTFDADISVGGRIKINGEKFFVSGIFGKQGMGGVSSDSMVLMSSRDFKKLTGQSNISSIYLRVNNVNDAESIATTIQNAINENHGKKDFATATTMTSILKTVQNIIGILQLVLVGIASIALVVASIGIMNTMLTSVMERTREIGIMKAIGATTQDIMSIFIIEGVLMSGVGGIIGIILGVFGSQALTLILGSFMSMGGGSFQLVPIITITSVVLAVAVSLIVGVLSSLYPAWRAARMSPIEAVRYE
ncbi:MAG: ABC transporter permease [Thermoplasmata archaeon]|nr:ABC transporter permease [Thermoplasmata archaeon]MBE3137954.1 ABC transporter permease [Thermoplasmata archaeon]MBE3140565.1 ABC transporter permease [Thermoplasmata archaeon]